jgi:predicted outer membrane repeat protein
MQSTAAVSVVTVSGGGGGGAIYMSDVAYIWVVNSNFQNNTAFRGGAIYQTTTDVDSQIT